MKQLFVFLLSFALFSCSGDSASTGNSGTSSETETPANATEQLNISILLDLSDRIDPASHAANPSHAERDIAIIKQLATYFKNDMDSKGTYMSKGKMKVFFSPNPEDSQINLYAQKLNVDLSGMDNKQKKEVYTTIEKNFEEAARNIYGLAIKQGKWDGADIWRFFKNDVKDYCVSKDKNYRNILVILTDGYLYHADSKNKENNRTSYITSVLFDQAGFRDNPDWKAKFEQGDYGLLTERKDLQDLEVLVLEVTPSEKHKNDEDIIKKYLDKWFTEMEVKRFAVFNTDLPENTKQRVSDFLKQ